MNCDTVSIPGPNGELTLYLHPSSSKDIVILCHGLQTDVASSSTITTVTQFLKSHSEFGVCAFDFHGCGNSAGIASYGNYWEQVLDLNAVVLHLQQQYHIQGLIGHSMGTWLQLSTTNTALITRIRNFDLFLSNYAAIEWFLQRIMRWPMIICSLLISPFNPSWYSSFHLDGDKVDSRMMGSCAQLISRSQCSALVFLVALGWRRERFGSRCAQSAIWNDTPGGKDPTDLS